MKHNIGYHGWQAIKVYVIHKIKDIEETALRAPKHININSMDILCHIGGLPKYLSFI